MSRKKRLASLRAYINEERKKFAQAGSDFAASVYEAYNTESAPAPVAEENSVDAVFTEEEDAEETVTYIQADEETVSSEEAEAESFAQKFVDVYEGTYTTVTSTGNNAYGEWGVDLFDAPEIENEEQYADEPQATLSGEEVLVTLTEIKETGTSLPMSLQDELERSLNADLTTLRIHTGEEANELVASVGGAAFAYGENIFFGQNHYDPESKEGIKLIAHETHHVARYLQDGEYAIRRDDDYGYGKTHKSEGKSSYWIKMAVDADGDGYNELQLLFNLKDHVLSVQAHHLEADWWSPIQKFVKYGIPYEKMGLRWDTIAFGEKSLTHGAQFGTLIKLYNLDHPGKADNTYHLWIYANPNVKTNGKYYLNLSGEVLEFDAPEKKFEKRENKISVQSVEGTKEIFSEVLELEVGKYKDKVYFQFENMHKSEWSGDEIKPGPKNQPHRLWLYNLGVYMRNQNNVISFVNQIPIYSYARSFNSQINVLSSDEKSVSLNFSAPSEYADGFSDETELKINFYIYPYLVSDPYKTEPADDEEHPELNRKVVVYMTGPALYHDKHVQSFKLLNNKVQASRTFSGAADYDRLRDFYAPEHLGMIQLPGSIYQEIGTNTGVIYQLMQKLVDKDKLWKSTFEAWQEYAYGMIQLESVLTSRDEVDQLERKSIIKSVAERADYFFSLLRRETFSSWERRESSYGVCGAQTRISYANPYTGEYSDNQPEAAEYFKKLPANSPGDLISHSKWKEAREKFTYLKEHYQQYAISTISDTDSDELKKDKDALVHWRKMGVELDKLKDMLHLQKIKAVWYEKSNDTNPSVASAQYKFNQGAHMNELVVPLQLWAYVNPADNKWYIKDLINVDEPFLSSSVPFVQPEKGKPVTPPEELFKGLDHEKHLPEGTIYYELNGKIGQVTTTGEKTDWWDIVGWIALGLTAIGVGLVTFGTGTVAVLGTVALYVSAGAAIVSTVAQLHDDYKHNQLDSKTLFLGILDIFSSLLQIKLLAIGRVLNTSSKAAKFAGLVKTAERLYVPLKIAEYGTDGLQVMIMTVDTANDIQAILNGPGSEESKQRAIFLLVSQATVSNAFFIMDLRGMKDELDMVKKGKRDLHIEETDKGEIFVRPGDEVVQSNKRVDPSFQKDPDWKAPVNGVHEYEYGLMKSTLGEKKMLELDAFLKKRPDAEELIHKYGTTDVYHALNLSNGDDAVLKKLLDNSEFVEWRHSVNKETMDALNSDADIFAMYRDMDPRARRLLTLCASVCVPKKISKAQKKRVEALVKKYNLTGDEMSLKEYLHRNKVEDDLSVMDNALDELEKELSNLPVGHTYDDVIKAIDDKLEKLLIDEAQAKGWVAKKTSKGWTLRKGNQIVNEYDSDGYRLLQKSNKGTDSFFQAHHGVQGEWAQVKINKTVLEKYKINGKSVFDEAELYSYDKAPALNLRDSHGGTPHQRITARQNGRKLEIENRTYADERALAEEDLRIANVPEDIIQAELAKNDQFYKGLHDKIKKKLTDNMQALNLDEAKIEAELFAIFGMNQWPE